MPSPTAARLWRVIARNPGFRRLYTANAISQIGDWFNVVALYSLLLQLTGKGEAVALALLTRLLPMFLVGPAAGVVADRLSRRAILITCDLLRAALVLVLLLVRRPEQAWIAYATMTAHSIASAFFEPAQAATFPGLVAEEDLVLASTLENSLWAATLAVGSSLAGVVIAAVGRDAAFALDAASFLASAAFLRGLPPGRARPAPAAAREEAEAARDLGEVGWANLLGLTELRAGLRWALGHARVRALLVVKACFGFTLGGIHRAPPRGGEAHMKNAWIAVPALAVLVSCGSSKQSNAALGKSFNYGPAQPPTTSEQTAGTAAQSSVSDAASVSASPDPTHAASLITFADAMGGAAFGSTGLGAIAPPADQPRRSVEDTTTCAKVSGGTVTFSNCSQTFSGLTINLNGSITSAAGAVGWDITSSISGTTNNSLTLSVNDHAGGSLTVAGGKLGGNATSEIGGTVSGQGQNLSFGVSTAVIVDLTYQTTPKSCFTGGTVEVKRVWTQKPQV